MAVRGEAEGQREPVARATAALPEPRAPPAAVGSVVRAASRPVAAVAWPLREVGRAPRRPEVHRAAPVVGAREMAARVGDKLREQEEARTRVPQEAAVVPGALEAKQTEARELEVRAPEVCRAPVGTPAARGRVAGAPRERAA
ncbi:MAG: hypothetical protein ABJA82_02605 [Myxococcales bacterium]